MTAGTQTCAIIPARAGSKGVPRKNLIPLLGKPLLAYSIEHALGAHSVERVIVSTEDPEIAEIATRFGAEVPFMRPGHLSEDHVLDLPVFQHALAWLEENEDYQPDLIVHLRPTAPIRTPRQIDDAVRMLVADGRADSVRSVSKPGQHPYRMFKIGPDGFLEPLLGHMNPEPFTLRRQDLPPIFWYNCVIDVSRRQTILDKHSMTGDRILPLVIDPQYVVDIDSSEDLVVAEAKLRHFGACEGGKGDY